MADSTLQTIYCDPNFLDRVIKNKKSKDAYNIAYSIIENIGNVIVDLPESALHERKANNPIYKKLSKRGNLGLESMPKKGISMSSFDYGSIVDELVFTNDKKNDNNDKRERYGIMAVSSDDIDCLTALVRNDIPILLVPLGRNKITGTLYRSDPYITYMDSWKEIFAPVIDGCSQRKLQPLNAMIISDNYMFTSQFESRKQKSLFEVLKSIIPTNLETDFHLSIFTSNAYPDKN